ncbi:uncharacterized protein EI97DRAFT_367254 [Westerdykella ornata]|uniref:Pentatricopeptide repeat protein-like protein n=1 Tax=Westerdykella ornata TaxID=318751 RepID=A0A6A6JY66_WESOR|nr:uncharacterized protein EI97DRAFT_367254 [Westerdykella ornata]KAF2281571.1 hypothetical protein EI97DRAFT_367254 [Westerdykella ornata]
MKKKERKALTRPLNASIPDFRIRRKELKYLADPLALANYVKKMLRKDRDVQMLNLVRMASREGQRIVSWNHLIDWALQKGRLAHALKMYNEMKKRAQFPDAYTYAILLNGMTNCAHASGVLEKALSVYHSMFADNSRVQPSIIHTNAMLKLCARMNNMDALWGVAAKIPDKGPATANAITYTIILNAIRQSLLVGVPPMESDEQRDLRRDRGVVEGRRVWEEVVSKWRDAQLVIAEELVCAMGRLLLVGARPRDWDDVLSLVEQTMDIPRFVPRLGSVERREAGLPHLRAPNVSDQFRYDDSHLSPSKNSRRGDEFLPVLPQGVEGVIPSTLTYAKPSNNTLSLVLEACQKIVAKDAADRYWNLLTDPSTYAITPDLNNLNFRLRLLRQNRASTEAVKLLKEYFVDKKKSSELGLEMRPGTLRIAMSTCVRDKNNHRSLWNAGEILAIMMDTLEDADAKTVTRYADLAVAFPLAKGGDLVEALARLEPVVRNLRMQLGVGASDMEPWAKGHKIRSAEGAVILEGEQREAVIEALRRVYAVHDKLINSNLVSEREKEPFKRRKARLSAFLHRLGFKERVKSLPPGMKWDRMKGRLEMEEELEET